MERMPLLRRGSPAPGHRLESAHRGIAPLDSRVGCPANTVDMALALQALLPFVALLGAAAIVRQRPRSPGNGWIAAAATGLAGVIALVELLRLSPGEHVDVPYLTSFPYADLAIRLDGLSLAFATITLITAALLMMARQRFA